MDSGPGFALDASRALRVAVAGTGAFGRNHLRVYREMAGVELVAAIEPSAERAAEVAEQYEIPVFDSGQPDFDLPESVMRDKIHTFFKKN